jgi:coenzyme F420-0:L-glutamate ligase/coenzyme F420-1:gamma-L-glutamate ligase
MTAEPGDAPPLTAAAFHHILRSRRSIRNYRDEAIAADVLERLFISAAAAPSAHNRQPWRYVVIDDAPRKHTLARAMGERLAADRRRDGDAEEAIARDVARSFARITGAPVLILVCLTLEHADAYPDAARREAEFLMAVQGTAMATQNLLLAAHAEGLAACWMCAPLFCPDVVRAALDIAPHWQPQGLITLGRPADDGRVRPRRAVGEFVVSAQPRSSPSPRSYGERVGVRGLSASADGPNRMESPLIPTFSPHAGRRRSGAAPDQAVLPQVANDGGESPGHPDPA